MDFYKDLSYYSHFHYERAKNIGFGDQVSHGQKKQLNAEFVKKLTRYLAFPVNTARGGSMKTLIIDGHPYTFGFSEIRVLDSSGNAYAAPDSMIANVMEGKYFPPHEFVEAVLNGPAPESKEYQNYLKRYRPEYCWGESNDYVKTVVLLLKLISQGNIEGLEKVLGASKNLINIVCGGGSLLNEAITRKQEKTAIYLVQKGINLEMFEGVELLTAVDQGMLSIVQLLLNSNVPIKMNRPRTNPLFLSIGKQQNEIAEYLYINRKDLVQIYNTEYVQNCNILQWTKMCNNFEFMQFLTTYWG